MTNQPDPGPWHRILDPAVDGPRLPTDEWWDSTDEIWIKCESEHKSFFSGIAYRRRKFIPVADIPADAPDDLPLWTPKGWMTTVKLVRLEKVAAVMLRLEGETEPPEPYRPSMAANVPVTDREEGQAETHPRDQSLDPAPKPCGPPVQISLEQLAEE